MTSHARYGTAVSRRALSAGPAVAVEEEENDGTRAWREPPVWSKRPGAKAATGDAKLKWTQQTMSPVLVRRGVDAAVAAAGGRREGTLLAARMVLLVKWPK